MSRLSSSEPNHHNPVFSIESKLMSARFLDEILYCFRAGLWRKMKHGHRGRKSARWRVSLQGAKAAELSA